MITINPEKLVKNANASGEFIFRGGLALQAELGAQNVNRFRKIFNEHHEVQHLCLQQALLQSKIQNEKTIKGLLTGKTTHQTNNQDL